MNNRYVIRNISRERVRLLRSRAVCTIEPGDYIEVEEITPIIERCITSGILRMTFAYDCNKINVEYVREPEGDRMVEI